MKHLTKVLKYLNSIENINRGGCGIAALAIYRWLENNDMLRDTEIVLLYDYNTHYLYSHNYKILKSNSNGIPHGAPHIVLKRLNRYFDSEGFLSKRGLASRYCDMLSVDVNFLLTAINDNIDCWNYEFKRKNNVLNIANQLNIDLSDVLLIKNTITINPVTIFN